MTPHTEILSHRLRETLRRIGGLLTESGFYLGGGTALALQLGHRRSVDLDWFRTDPLGDPHRWAQRLTREAATFQTDLIAAGTLHGRLAGTRISLLEYRYRLLEPPVLWEGGPCRLASLADLAAMKLAAVSQRGAKKDFVDLYVLQRQGISLTTMLDGYRAKYDVTDTMHVLYSLGYFEDADRERMPPLLQPISWRIIKATFRERVGELIRNDES